MKNAVLLMALLAAAPAAAQLSRYMGGGIGNGAAPSEAVVGPYHLDLTDRLCIADYSGMQARCVQERVHKLATFAGRPVGIARDAGDGRVYVSTLKVPPAKPSGETIPGGLWAIEPDGATRALPLPAGAAPYGLLLRDGFLWYADQQRNEIVRLPLPCAPTCAAETVVAPTAGLRNPQDIAWCDELIIADTSNSRIRALAENGTLRDLAGSTPGFAGDGGPAAAAQLSFPTGLAAVGTPCTVYVADSGNNRVRRFTVGGAIETVAGSGRPNPDKLPPGAEQDPRTFPISQPNDVAVDGASGSLYIGSTFDAAIYRFPISVPRQ
jgi:hypothetical protein